MSREQHTFEAGTHSEEFRKKFGSEQGVIRGPELGSTRHQSLVVDSQFLGDFWTGYNFMENLILSRARGLGFEISFNLRRGE